MSYKFIYLTILFFFYGCSNNLFTDNNSAYDNYFEDFEEKIIFNQPSELDGGSYVKYGTNNWISFMENSYTEYNCSNTWNWEKVDDANSGHHALRGTTNKEGLGILWLFKKFRVIPNQKISISVYGRTKKIHSGSLTGPALYVFDGKINYPSVEHHNLIGSDYYQWDSRSWSDWRKLDTIVDSKSEWITIALCVKDAWIKFPIYHEFDNLRIKVE